jgi:2-methylcitrate dehydratase PrpD
MPNLTQSLAAFVVELTDEKIPQQVHQRVKQIILDHVGVATRARHQAALSPPMYAALKEMGQLTGECRVIGDSEGYSPYAAAVFNGNLGHALDFDDTHAPSSLHSGAPIIPAAMSAAQITGASGAEVLRGIIAGFEIQIRLSLALNPSAHYEQGFHPTATCGVFGAAAASAVVMGLSQEQIQNAFGLCASHAAGTMQFLLDGAWNKPYHTGFAAGNGLMAATMAKHGFVGVSEAFEGRYSFLHAYAPDSDHDLVLDGLGSQWKSMGIAVKPYPACRYTHAALDALISLKTQHKIDYQQIESVEIGIPKTGIKLVGEPLADKQNPQNYVDGKFSLPFVAAVGLRDGAMGWDSYAQHLNDNETLSLCRKVSVVNDPLVEQEFPANMSGLARLKTNAGSYEQLVVVPKGEPDNFMSDTELMDKFTNLTAPYLSESRRGELTQQLFALEQVTNIGALMDLTRPDLTQA